MFRFECQVVRSLLETALIAKRKKEHKRDIKRQKYIPHTNITRIYNERGNLMTFLKLKVCDSS